jgi:heme/copper-type cytochrome/quinol oxidase subunit 2
MGNMSVASSFPQMEGNNIIITIITIITIAIITITIILSGLNTEDSSESSEDDAEEENLMAVLLKLSTAKEKMVPLQQQQ